MAYISLHPMKQLDFQINRILTYGDEACDFNEVKSVSQEITDLASWHNGWKALGEKAESESRRLHAAYYYRLAEFFLSDSPEKQIMYEKSIENFHAVYLSDSNMYIEYVPYMGVPMKTFVFPCEKPIGDIVVFGGYDSFIEEFYLSIKGLAETGYNIYLFEGPGQGETLKRGLTFEPHWEKPIGAVLDYFHLDNVCVIGISWGGYLALRSAAYDKRISKAVAYDALYDGFDCMTNPFPVGVRGLIRFLFRVKAKPVINSIMQLFMKQEIILNWAISHGEHIAGTKNPYDFYTHLMKHTLKNDMEKITCDTLLLAGERDHYIPNSHYEILMKGITNAKSLTGKMFTEAEGGAEHCQIGNHQLAVTYIINWIQQLQCTE